MVMPWNRLRLWYFRRAKRTDRLALQVTRSIRRTLRQACPSEAVVVGVQFLARHSGGPRLLTGIEIRRAIDRLVRRRILVEHVGHVGTPEGITPWVAYEARRRPIVSR